MAAAYGVSVWVHGDAVTECQPPRAAVSGTGIVAPVYAEETDIASYTLCSGRRQRGTSKGEEAIGGWESTKSQHNDVQRSSSRSPRTDRNKSVDAAERQQQAGRRVVQRQGIDQIGLSSPSLAQDEGFP